VIGGPGQTNVWVYDISHELASPPSELRDWASDPPACADLASTPFGSAPEYAGTNFGIPAHFLPDALKTTMLSETYYQDYGGPQPDGDFANYSVTWHLTRAPDADCDGIPNGQDNAQATSCSGDQGVQGIVAYCEGVVIGQQECLIALLCPGTYEVCRGRVKLLANLSRRGVAGKRGRSAPLSTFGKARFSIPGDKTKKVELRLTNRAKKYIRDATAGRKRKRKLRGIVRITGTNPSTHKITIKLKR
jgi:hypothetical protein